jgi:serine/threonine protein kinase
MVMDYIKNGSIHQFLKNNYNRLKLYEKLILIWNIANGLREIHDKGFIHKNLHSSNILSHDSVKCYISDLGLCEPVNEQTKDDEKRIYGVLPYVAPEVLKDKTYTQAADIYSFGILTYEILSELPPYHDLPHDESLASKICQGLRPKFRNVKVLPLLEKLIDQCLDADLLTRPTADELYGTLNKWISNFTNKDAEFSKQYKEVKEFNKTKSSKSNNSPNTSSPSYTINSQAIYHSRPLEYKNLPSPQNSKEINTQGYNSLAITEYPGNYF